MDTKLCEAPQRLVVNYKFDHPIVEAKNEEYVRYRGGIKSEVLTSVKAKDEMWLMEEYENWVQVDVYKRQVLHPQQSLFPPPGWSPMPLL